jgi:hypothetical protein
MRYKPTPTFILTLPLQVNAQQAARLHAHFECARQLYNALLAEALKRLRRMKADPAWQAARSLPRSDKLARTQVFTRLRMQYGFSEYGLHEAAKRLRTSWLASHIDSLMAQKLASRAYQAANRVCVGEARRVRFRSQGRGLDSVEGKSNTSGLRFHLQAGAHGTQGWLSWHGERIPALIDWQDEVIHHGLQQRIKYVRLLRQPASSPQARGADCRGFVYAVQLMLEGHPLQKPTNRPGKGAVGLDLGPSTLAIVPEVGPARLLLLAEELHPMRAHAAGCNATWSESVGPTIPSTTMHKAASKNETKARNTVCGGKVTALSRPAGAWQPRSASWPRTGAACMATWPTRSSAWAMTCGSRKSATRAGSAALAEAWGCVPLGAL